MTDKNFDVDRSSPKRRKVGECDFPVCAKGFQQDEWVVKLRVAAKCMLESHLPLETDKCHTLLGAGQNAAVFSYRISNDVSIAYKKTKIADKEARERKVRLETAIEGRVMSFLTQTFIQPLIANDGEVFPLGLGCPNLVGVLRHDFGRNVVRFATNEADYREKDITASSLWLELCDRETFSDYYHGDVTVGEIVRLPLAVSVILQMVMAILACGGVGVFHNDMRMSNWLMRSRSTPVRGLLYCIPATEQGAADVYVRLPGAPCIPLVAVSDFGLASVDGWINDPRIEDWQTCPESVALMCNYYDAKERNTTELPRLSLTSTGDSLGHFRPLSFGKLQRYQRDMATVFTYFEAIRAEQSGHQALGEFQRLASKAIDILTEIRPASYADQRRVALKMFATMPEFAACVVAKPAADSTEPVYRLPGDVECAMLSKDLFDRVSTNVKNRNEYKLKYF